MFYVIYIAVIVFALYLIFHDRPEGDGARRKPQARVNWRPEQQAPVRPQAQQRVAEPRVAQPRPARPARPVAPTADPFAVQRDLSWTYLSSLEYDGEYGRGEGAEADLMHTEITGMRYHCSLADLGPVNGFVKPEPENPHDPEAQVVVRADGKVLGYIPRVALPEYLNFNPAGLICPFAGYVKVTRQGSLWAEILVALPVSREFVEEELTDYLELEQPAEA